MAGPKAEIEITVLDHASRALKNIREKLAGLNGGKVGKAMAHLSQATKQSGKVLAAYGAAAGVAAGGAVWLTKNVMDTASEFERFETILSAIEGSSEKAKKSMAWISDFAAKTPYEMNEVTDAFVKLKAYGLDPIKNGLLTSLGDTSAAMGKPVMDAVEAIADAITGENERLKEFGIKASKIKGTQFTEYAYTDKDGKQQTARVESDNRAQIQATLQAIWNDKYGGAMNKLSGTWEGMMSNLSDQWERFKLLIAQSGVFDFLKDKLSGLLEKIDAMAQDGSLQKLAETIGSNLVGAFEKLWDWGNRMYDRFVAINEFFGGFENTMTAVAVVAALPFVAALANIGVALVSLAVALAPAIAAVWAFTAALLANPITWIIAGIAALAGAIYWVCTNWDTVSGWLSGFWDGIKSAAGAAFDWLGDLFMNFTPLGLIISNWEAITGWLSGFWQGVKDFASQAFDFLGMLFISFTPLGMIIGNWTAITQWLPTFWQSVKTLVADALAAVGGVLSGFDPLGYVREKFEQLKGYLADLWSSIKSGFARAFDLSSTAVKMPAAGPMPQPAGAPLAGGAGRVDIHINHTNVPAGVSMKTGVSGNNRPNLSTKQGITNR